MRIDYYREGTDRNEGCGGYRVKNSHTYAETNEGLFPMCGYGWNRSDGTAFSIFRGSPDTEGSCKICQKNIAAGKPPVKDGFPHKTKWL